MDTVIRNGILDSMMTAEGKEKTKERLAISMEKKNKEKEAKIAEERGWHRREGSRLGSAFIAQVNFVVITLVITVSKVEGIQKCLKALKEHRGGGGEEEGEEEGGMTVKYINLDK